MYKDKDKAREAARIRKQRQRGNVTPFEDNVTPSGENVTPFEPIPDPDVTPLVTPNVTPYDHPDKIQCGAIERNWDDLPDWMQRSYMRSTHKWESMLVCVPDYARPTILSTPNDIN